MRLLSQPGQPGRENGIVVDDGLHEIFVNTVIKDGSRISDLMSCFSSKDVNTTEFPTVTKRFRELKKAERIQAIQKMIALDFPKDKVLKMYSEEEYQEAVTA